MLYVAIDNRLSVHLIQAANIPYREGAEGLDVFCKVHLLPETGLVFCKVHLLPETGIVFCKFHLLPETGLV